MTFDEFDFEGAARVFAANDWTYSNTGPRIVPAASELRGTVRELQEHNERYDMPWSSMGRFIVFRDPEQIVCEATQPDEYHRLRIEHDRLEALDEAAKGTT